MKSLALLFLVVAMLSSCVGYVKKSDGVYYRDCNEANGCSLRKIDADPETFETLGDGYARDIDRVFIGGGPIEGADAATFKVLSNSYAVDKDHAYYGGHVIESSTGKNFKVIDAYYSTDDIDVFYQSNPLKVCSVKNFRRLYEDDKESLSDYWSTDGCYYYYMHFKIPSADYTNVQLLKETPGFAKDKQWVYNLDQKINFNIDGEKILDTVDAASFTINKYCDSCRDKFGCINLYKGRVPCN
ncbi:MAG TPA: DKNYY domain-containing protein [Chitinophagales bacterium]|nr:DKNYY domain-containing protein [Chitinophagales bacterium]